MSRFRTVVVLLLCAATVKAGDWPQWLGPKRDGSSPDKVAPWKEKETPGVLWKQDVGEGFSAPVVAGGRVFIHARVKDKEEEEVVALDAASGKILWKDSYTRPAYKSVIGSGPRATPTVADKRLYTIGINGFLSCYEVEKGKRLWQVDLYKQLKADLPSFAVCCSPLVVGDRVIVSVGGKGRCIIALNAENGEIEWQSLDDTASTSSALVFAGGGRAAGTTPDIVFMTPLRIVALDPIDGALRWEHPMAFQPQGTSPTPIAVGDNVVASTQAHGAVAVKIGKKEDKLNAEVAWQNKEMASYFSSGVASGDLIFLVTNTTEGLPATAITCVEAKTGKELWKKEKVGYYHAGLIRTGDDKLLVLNDAGLLTLLEVDAKGAKELARAKVCGGTLVNPALADGRLYVRDGKQVVCLKVGE
jgi:outer membrane protein assembly factor BamB